MKIKMIGRDIFCRHCNRKMIQSHVGKGSRAVICPSCGGCFMLGKLPKMDWNSLLPRKKRKKGE